MLLSGIVIDLTSAWCVQVVNLTRVTEKFMSSLLASMTGGVVTLGSDLTSAPLMGVEDSAGMAGMGPSTMSASSASKADAK